MKKIFLKIFKKALIKKNKKTLIKQNKEIFDQNENDYKNKMVTRP